MKNTHSVAAGGVSLSVKPSEAHAINVCHNLRPTRLPSGTTAIRPVGTPVRMSDTPMRPLTTMSADGKSYLIAAADNRIYVIDTSPVETVMISVESGQQTITLGGEILCALAESDKLTVMTSERAYRFRLSEGRLYEEDTASLPSISLMAEDSGDISVTVDCRTLSRSYASNNSVLADVDRRAISDDLRRAYADICRQAAASGAFIAPMVCRYRIMGRQGDTLLESPPLLLGPSDSSRLTAPHILRSSDRHKVAAWQMSLPSWRPLITLNGEIPPELSDIVDRIEVVASPGYHPYDSNEDASISIVSGASSDDFLHVTAAGASKSVSSGNSRQGQARLARIVGHANCMTDVIATMRPGPGANQETSITVSTAGVSEQCRQLDRLMSSRLIKTDYLLHHISPPHGFTAGCVVSAAGRELWGRLSAHRFKGYPAEVFAASKAGAGAWHAAVSVSFGGKNERVVAVSEGLSGAPLTFGPLLSYPSPDATSMTITVSTAGTVRTGTFALRPDMSNTHAIYIHPSLQPHSLADIMAAFVIPAEHRIKRRLDAYVCSCDTPLPYSPRKPKAMMTAGDGKVSSVWPCNRLSAGWESERQRMIVISDAGIYRATLNPTGSKPIMTMTLIERIAPAGDNAVTEAGGMLLAAVGRNLVKIGSGTVQTIAENIDARAIAYAAESDELWTDTAQGVKVIGLKSMSCYSRDSFRLGASAGKYAEVDGYTVDLSRENSASQTYVRWSGCIGWGDRYRYLREVVLDLRSESVTNGEMAVKRMRHADAASSPTCRLKADGRIMAPLVMQCMSLPTMGCQFDFQGRISHDSTITSVKISTS